MIGKKMLIVLIVLAMLGSVVFAAGTQEAESEAKYGGVERISLGASSVGSSSYNKLTIWSGYMGEKL